MLRRFNKSRVSIIVSSDPLVDFSEKCEEQETRLGIVTLLQPILRNSSSIFKFSFPDWNRVNVLQAASLGTLITYLNYYVYHAHTLLKR